MFEKFLIFHENDQKFCTKVKTNNFLNHNSTARNCDAQHIKHIKTHFLRAKSPSITQPEEKYFMAHLLCVTPTNLYNT